MTPTDPTVWDVIRATRHPLGREFLHLLMAGEANLPEAHDAPASTPWDRAVATRAGVRLWKFEDGWAAGAGKPHATWAQIRAELHHRIDPAPLASLWAAEETAREAYSNHAHEHSLAYIRGKSTDEQRDRANALASAHDDAERAALTALRTLIERAPTCDTDELGTSSLLDLLEETT